MNRFILILTALLLIGCNDRTDVNWQKEQMRHRSCTSLESIRQYYINGGHALSFTKMLAASELLEEKKCPKVCGEVR